MATPHLHNQVLWTCSQCTGEFWGRRPILSETEVVEVTEKEYRIAYNLSKSQTPSWTFPWAEAESEKLRTHLLIDRTTTLGEPAFWPEHRILP